MSRACTHARTSLHRHAREDRTWILYMQFPVLKPCIAEKLRHQADDVALALNAGSNRRRKTRLGRLVRIGVQVFGGPSRTGQNASGKSKQARDRQLAHAAGKSLAIIQFRGHRSYLRYVVSRPGNVRCSVRWSTRPPFASSISASMT